MNNLSRTLLGAATAIALASVTACADDETSAAVTAGSKAPAETTAAVADAVGAGTATTQTTAGPVAPVAYVTVSDVDSHAAIGDDIAAIKAETAKAKEDLPVDWDVVGQVFTEGGASKKGDGSTRTLAGLVDAPDIVAMVNAAIADNASSDAVRAQRVEKGISVLLHLKVLDELDAAATKLADGKTDPADGAPHNVDEAWAFYTANGNGLQSTAIKRGDDFGVDADSPLLTALAAAQQAAGAGQADAFDAATEQVRGALNYVFYLATYKYLDHGGNEAKQAEGATFYLAIAPTVEAADPAAHQQITAAFVSGDAASGREALNQPAVLDALGVDPTNAITD